MRLVCRIGVLLLATACATEAPPLYEHAYSGEQTFERCKTYCLNVSRQSMSARNCAPSEREDCNLYDPSAFDVCMAHFGWKRVVEPGPTGRVTKARPAIRAE